MAWYNISERRALPGPTDNALSLDSYCCMYHLPDRLHGLSLVGFLRWLTSGSNAEGCLSGRLPFDGDP